MSVDFEATRARRSGEPFFLHFLQALALLSLTTFVVLIVAAHAVPEASREINGRGVSENVFSAKNACVSSEPQNAEFSEFCQEVFQISRQGMFLKARTEIPHSALAIFRDKHHALYRYLRIDGNAYELFGEAESMLVNRIAAYSHAECEVSTGQIAGIAGF
ncbi:MAG: hypothetical protein ABJJ37_19480, partial [Roseibium sp.]